MANEPKEKPETEIADQECENGFWAEDQKKHEYYYDDAHGYEKYDPLDEESDPAEDENRV